MKYDDFINRFEKKRKTGQGFLTRCPAHDDSDKTPSLSISPARDGGVLVKCFAGCTAPEIVGSLGLTMKDLFSKEQPVKFTPPPAKEIPKENSVPDVRPAIEKIYSYKNANGVEVYQALRMNPKSFRQRHRNPAFGDAPPGFESTEKEWIWTMEGVERVLYRLPEIFLAQTVWISEGEKDVENLVKLGFEATTNVGGSKNWLESYGENFTGKDVVICGDNDKIDPKTGRKPGDDYVTLVSETVAPFAKTVRVVKLPETIKDVSDYIAEFKTPKEACLALQELAGAAHPKINGHSLPIYSIGEMEDDYRRFVRSMGDNSFSLGKWLPTLGIKLRARVPGELIFFIGDTGTGKTAVLSNIAKAACPLPTLMFELELPKEIMFERFASLATRFTGEQIEAAYQSADDSIQEDLEKKFPNLCVCPVARLTLAEIERIILRSELKLGSRPRVVLIDYIQLIKGEGANRREKTSDIAEELKIMAKSTRTIIIVTSQISRPKDVDENWEPSLHSAKESGSIEASCSLLISLWQDMKESGTLNLRVLKSTNGGTGTFVKCNFDGSRMIINERQKTSQFSNEDVPDQRD